MSTSTKLLVGSALIMAAVAAKSYMSNKTDTSSSHELVEFDDENEGDFITGDDVCKVFDRLFMEMQAVLAQLSHTVQQIQMSGQVIPEKQLRQLLITEYERAHREATASS
jgi:hypothetical protein